MDWYKAYHGMPYDARIAAVARRAQIRRAEALALWVALLDRASQGRPRGQVGEVDPEELAVPLELEPKDAARALQAFRDKGMLTQTGAIGGWEKMQATSTARVRRHRSRMAGLRAEQEKRKEREEPPAAAKNEKEDEEDALPPLSALAAAPPPPALEPDDPAEIARRRLRLQRKLQATRRPAKDRNDKPRNDKPRTPEGDR